MINSLRGQSSSASCLDCLAGYSTFGQTATTGTDHDNACTICPIGSYSSSDSSSYCSSCSAGWYMHTTIPVGYGYPNEGELQQPGETDSTLCDIYSCDAGYDTEDQAGRYGASPTSDACVRCQAGQYAVSAGTGSCTLCAAGKYMDDELHTQTTEENCIWCGQTTDNSNIFTYI